MTDAEGWIRARLGSAPPALLDTMTAALPPEDLPVPDALSEAALGLYARAVAGTGGREDALPLLAADALLTHAFEAEAERGSHGGRLESRAREWSARLTALAREASS